MKIRRNKNLGRWLAVLVLSVASILALTAVFEYSSKVVAGSCSVALTGSAFSDTDAEDTHLASQWIVTEGGSGIYDSGRDTVNLTTIAISGSYFTDSHTYAWKVRYQDQHFSWGSYSDEASFTYSCGGAPTAISSPEVTATSTATSNPADTPSPTVTSTATPWNWFLCWGQYWIPEGCPCDWDAPPPAWVKVLSPNGGEHYKTCDILSISYAFSYGIWGNDINSQEAQDMLKKDPSKRHDIYISTDGGHKYVRIAKDFDYSQNDKWEWVTFPEFGAPSVGAYGIKTTFNFPIPAGMSYISDQTLVFVNIFTPAWGISDKDLGDSWFPSDPEDPIPDWVWENQTCPNEWCWHCTLGGPLRDISDDNCEIGFGSNQCAAPTPTPTPTPNSGVSINVIAPKTGDRWEIGTIYQILWEIIYSEFASPDGTLGSSSSQSTGIPEHKCQSYPPPSFCQGKNIVSVGKDSNDCNIWRCSDAVVEKVNISLSTDGGRTFNEPLALSNDNTGVLSVKALERYKTNHAVIKVDGFNRDGQYLATGKSGEFIISRSYPICIGQHCVILPICVGSFCFPPIIPPIIPPITDIIILLGSLVAVFLPWLLALLAASPALTRVAESLISNGLAPFWIALVNFLSHPFTFFYGVKKRPNFGIVYDSITKQPIPGAAVRVYSVEDEKLRKIQYTNNAGGFAILVPSGKYTLTASKFGFKFPTHIVKTKTDGQYENVYFGEEILIGGRNNSAKSPVKVNIPIDQTKGSLWDLTLVSFVRGLQRFFYNVRIPLMLFGVFLTVYLCVKTQAWYYYVILFAYALMWFVEIKERFSPRMYGLVKDGFGRPVGLAMIRVVNAAGKIKGTVVTGDDGRFVISLNEGSYKFLASRVGYIASSTQAIKISKLTDLGKINIKLEKIKPAKQSENIQDLNQGEL